MSGKNSKYSIADIILLLAITAVAGLIYAGFYFPDTFYMERGGAIYRYVSLGIRVAFPIVFLGFLLIVHRVKTGRLPASKAALSAASFVFAGLLAYPVANTIYNRSKRFENHAGSYHPYLQLVPQDFKPRENASGKPFRIFCLGGSTTEWRDSGDRGWPSRVQENLRNSLGRDDIETYNLGREWYTSLHTMINYTVNLRRHRPDMIIVMHGINDLLHNADFSYFSHGPFQPDYRHFYGPVNNIVANKGMETFLARGFRRFWYHKERRVVEPAEFPGVPCFVRNLDTLIDLAERDGTRVILMTQPNLFKETMSAEELDALYMINHEAIGPREQWSAAAGLSGFRQYNEAVRDLGKTRRVPVIDLETALPKTVEYFQDDVHYTDPAFDRVAEFVSIELVRQDLIPPADQR